jgi:hypothetical protein
MAAFVFIGAPQEMEYALNAQMCGDYRIAPKSAQPTFSYTAYDDDAWLKKIIRDQEPLKPATVAGN